MRAAKLTRRSEAGQAMVEFALVILFIFILFVSVIQMIMFMHTYNTLANAAKEGVRYAIVHGTQNSSCSSPNTSTICPTPNGSPYNNVKDAVLNFASVSIQNVTRADVTVAYFPKDTTGAACGDPGCMVRVTVAHQYDPLFGLGWPNFTVYAASEGRIMN
jgi:Flp pilus assembly protein TadG